MNLVNGQVVRVEADLKKRKEAGAILIKERSPESFLSALGGIWWLDRRCVTFLSVRVLGYYGIRSYSFKTSEIFYN